MQCKSLNQGCNLKAVRITRRQQRCYSGLCSFAKHCFKLFQRGRNFPAVLFHHRLVICKHGTGCSERYTEDLIVNSTGLYSGCQQGIFPFIVILFQIRSEIVCSAYGIERTHLVCPAACYIRSFASSEGCCQSLCQNVPGDHLCLNLDIRICRFEIGYHLCEFRFVLRPVMYESDGHRFAVSRRSCFRCGIFLFFRRRSGIRRSCCSCRAAAYKSGCSSHDCHHNRQYLFVFHTMSSFYFRHKNESFLCLSAFCRSFTSFSP